MRTSFAFAILATLCAVEAASTVTCSAGCPSSPVVEDIVTRSDEPVSSCADAKLTAVYNSDATMATSLVTPGVPGSDGTQGAQPTPTGNTPVEAGAEKVMWNAGVAIAAVGVAVYMA